MGLIANVYRMGQLVSAAPRLMRFDDCTIEGWSVNFDKVCVINAEGPFEPDDQYPAVLIVRHRTMPCLNVVSAEHDLAHKWTMFGGNFLYSSDSRFGEACRMILAHGNSWRPGMSAYALRKYEFPDHMGLNALPIHDRIEG